MGFHLQKAINELFNSESIGHFSTNSKTSRGLAIMKWETEVVNKTILIKQLWFSFDNSDHGQNSSQRCQCRVLKLFSPPTNCFLSTALIIKWHSYYYCLPAHYNMHYNCLEDYYIFITTEINTVKIRFSLLPVIIENITLLEY